MYGVLCGDVSWTAVCVALCGDVSWTAVCRAFCVEM